MGKQAGQGRLRIIAGSWKGRRLDTPPGWELRPTQGKVREALFSRLLGHLAEARVVDLFAGSGALGLEALSRGARHVTFVEQSAGALKALAANLSRLEADAQGSILAGDVFAFLAGKLGASVEVDLLLADPPYGEWPLKTVRAIDASPILQWRPGAIRAIEMGRDDPLWEPGPGWSRWPARVYGKSRVIIEQREMEHEHEQ